MPSGVELCRIQLPGRESRLREPPFQDLGPLTDALLEVLEPYADTPFAIFGHSMGAVVGFELARACKKELGREPRQLFVSAQRAPQLPPEPNVHALPEQEFIREVRFRYGGIPDAVLREPELLALMLPLLRADLAVCESSAFSVEPRLECPITAYGGVRDKWVAPDHLPGWGDHTSADFEIELFEGDHFFIDTHRKELLKSVCTKLRRLVMEV
jgi:medium-chain acyl-[acyl-carrier-protein] hydrolase